MFILSLTEAGGVGGVKLRPAGGLGKVPLLVSFSGLASGALAGWLQWPCFKDCFNYILEL